MMTELENFLDQVVLLCWQRRSAADALNKKVRAFPVPDDTGTWLFYVSSDKDVHTITGKLYVNPHLTATDGANSVDKVSRKCAKYGKVDSSGLDLEITLHKDFCLKENGDIKGLRINLGNSAGLRLAPSFLTKSAAASAIQTIASLPKPKNDQGCECGAFAIGAKKGDNGHSDWCAAKGHGTKKTPPNYKTK